MTELSPTKVLFFQSSSGDFSDELHVVDLSADLTLGAYNGEITEDFRKQVEKISKEKKHDRSRWSYELKRNTFSSTMQFHDAASGGAVVAELGMSILQRLGTWKISFPNNSKHSSHDIEMRPVSFWKKEETFVKDSVQYLWDAAGGAKGGKLYKVVDEKVGTRVPVAEYVAKKWFQNSCVLVMDTTQLDELVVLASCVAILNRQT